MVSASMRRSRPPVRPGSPSASSRSPPRAWRCRKRSTACSAPSSAALSRSRSARRSARTARCCCFVFALWMGLCSAVASLLRDFRSYGAAISGYTVAIIAIGGIDDPNGLLLASLNRTAAILLGIASVALMNSLFGGVSALDKLVDSLRIERDKVAAFALDALEERPVDDDLTLTQRVVKHHRAADRSDLCRRRAIPRPSAPARRAGCDRLAADSGFGRADDRRRALAEHHVCHPRLRSGGCRRAARQGCDAGRTGDHRAVRRPDRRANQCDRPAHARRRCRHRGVDRRHRRAAGRGAAPDPRHPGRLH